MEKRQKVLISLDAETYRKLKAHMLTIGVWNSYRERTVLEREFRRLPYQPYEPDRSADQHCAFGQSRKKETRLGVEWSPRLRAPSVQTSRVTSILASTQRNACPGTISSLEPPRITS